MSISRASGRLQAMYAPTPKTPESAESACSGVACATVDFVSAVLVLAWAFAFVLVVVAAVVHLRRGREACEAERDRLSAERRAFQQFVRRVESLETADTAGTPVPAGATASLSQPTDGDDLDDVVQAYRNTVMSVEHYETDYGEPLRKNMAAELGADVTTAILDGQGLHPQLKMAVMSKCTEAYEQRTNVLKDIDDEVSEIARASEEVDSVEATLERLDRHSLLNKSFDELYEDYDALCALEGDCEDLLADRQRTVAKRDPSPNPKEGHDFHSYLYDPLDVSYPVLSTALTTLSTIRSARRRVLDSLTRRV